MTDPRHAPPGVDRRSFLACAGLASAALVTRGALASTLAQDPGAETFPIPPDKLLEASWIESLFARGEATVYSKACGELDFIGMPIGGIGCGHVYLGGDGTTWLWDVFNRAPDGERSDGTGVHYKRPLKPHSPLAHGFVLAYGPHGERRTLDGAGFDDVRFRGQFPIARVDYVSDGLPLRAQLEVFSPFVPLNADDSSLPAIVFEHTLENTSREPLDVELTGWFENRVAPDSLAALDGRRRSSLRASAEHAAIVLDALEGAPAPALRPDIVFEDFEKATFEGWTKSGTAFGDEPRREADMPSYMGPIGGQGERIAHSHSARNGEDAFAGDRPTGMLESRSFVIERHYVSLRIDGGAHLAQTCVNVVVDGKVVASETGTNSNRMRIADIDVRRWAGRSARIQIVDQVSGAWGQVGCDDIVFTDRPRASVGSLADAPDGGSFALAVAGESSSLRCALDAGAPESVDLTRLTVLEQGAERAVVERAHGARFASALSVRARLAPGERRRFTFVLAWHVPRVWAEGYERLIDARTLRRHYAARFRDAHEVAEHVLARRDELCGATRAWHAAFYERSTLPHWLLERSFASLSTLATATCQRFSNGRFYGWEGNYSCAGTCTHVWQYAQGVARIFPELERDVRERTDFESSFHEESGAIDYRGEYGRAFAIDGQCGTILRALREHQCSADDAFLRRVWPRVKRALELVIARDANADGLLEGAQYNTLDTTWWGEMAWISSLYVAALRAGEALASEMEDGEFAARCRVLAERGSRALVEKLFNGEWFVHRRDPAHPESNGTGNGCHIDQLLGQSFAHQLSLPRIVPEHEARTALQSLWRYNFASDIGPYRKRFDPILRGGRWFALPGEAGMVLCTWPKGGIESATGAGDDAWAAGYFVECMSGFEHQVAGHMLREGLVLEGLAVERAIHDRYHASKRNPWNEIECGDHYARALAGYGVYLAACGFEYHGPKGHIGFAPRVSEGRRFQCGFTGAEGFGTYTEERVDARQEHRLELARGRLRVATFAVERAETLAITDVACQVESASRAALNVPCRAERSGARILVTLAEALVLEPGREFVLTLA